MEKDEAVLTRRIHLHIKTHKDEYTGVMTLIWPPTLTIHLRTQMLLLHYSERKWAAQQRLTVDSGNSAQVKLVFFFFFQMVQAGSLLAISAVSE